VGVHALALGTAGTVDKAHMNGQRDARFLQRGPQLVVLGNEVVVVVRVPPDGDASHAGQRHRPLQLVNGGVDPDVGQERYAPQPLRVVGAVLRQPVVVGTNARQVKL